MAALQWCEHRGAFRMPLQDVVAAYESAGGETGTCISAAWAGRRTSEPEKEIWETWDWRALE